MELELRMVVNHCVDAENPTLVLKRAAVLLTTEQSLQPRKLFKNSHFFLKYNTHLQSADKCYTNPLTANEKGLEENGLCPLWGQFWGTD